LVTSALDWRIGSLGGDFVSYFLRDRRGRLHGLGDGPVASLGTPGAFGPNYNQWGDPITPAGVAASQASYAALQDARVAANPTGATGMSYDDLLAQANFQNCDPVDSVCVYNNQAKRDAVARFWAANTANGGIVPLGTVLTFPALTPAQTQQIKTAAIPEPHPGFFEGVTIQPTIAQQSGPPVRTVPVGFQQNSEWGPAGPPPSVAKTAAPTGSAPSGALVPGGSAAGGGASSSSSSSTIGGFDLSSVPWWAWAGGAAAAFFAFKGKG